MYSYHFDKDFGELAFCTKQPTARGIILFRIPMISSAYIAKALVKVIESVTIGKGILQLSKRIESE